MTRTLPSTFAVSGFALLLCACTSTGPARMPPTADVPDEGAAQVPAEAGFHQHAAPPQPPVLPSPVVVPINDAARAALPRAAVTATVHGETHRCEGVALAALLQAAGAMPAEPLRGAQLGRYVQVDARDGYRAVFSLAEFDPTLGGSAAFLVDRCDGAPLDGDSGPLRLLVPGDSRPARWVRQVRSITVIVAP